ncbi:MAG TPA: molybdopterin molybdotransferase MoeA [Steroidobacteraceae bacterium]|nr:molybdopterin molybdotransferase MoeA [Steroidobacteraceae bacterium]
MLDPPAADKLIGDHLACLPIESLPLGQCGGAVLRENIYAERDQPPFDRVAMDGVALASSTTAAGWRRFKLQGTQAAGDPPLTLASGEHCIEVMTGAVLPGGCDAVVPVEQTRSAEGYVELTLESPAVPWMHVARRASDRTQGALLLPSGSVLHAPEVAVAASAGMARLRVSSQPAIMVVSTGNELVEPGEPIAPHQIRRSNAYAVAAALRQQGFHRVAEDHLPDDAGLLRDRLRLHLTTHEALVLSGGVSMGRFDLVPKVLEELGVRCVFHGIAQRPGRPMWFGTSGEGSAVFALPGNPVSTLVCLVRYVVPALFGAMGRPLVTPQRVALAEPVDWQPAMTGFLPVRVAFDDWARTWATPCPTHNSGDFAALARTDGFVELPPGPAELAKGYVTRLFRW